MKIFVYKSLFIFILIFLLFHATFGYVLKSYESKVQNSFDKDKINFFKDKIRNEIEKGVNRDRILNNEDAILINKFINKLKEDLNDTN